MLEILRTLLIYPWSLLRAKHQLALAKLGLQAATATIREDRPQSRRKPSQGWWTFLRNHAGATIAAMDFFVDPTVTFRLVCVLMVTTHERRKVIHFNITEAPTSEWTAQQIINAFPYDTALPMNRPANSERPRIASPSFVAALNSWAESSGIRSPSRSPRRPVVPAGLCRHRWSTP